MTGVLEPPGATPVGPAEGIDRRTVGRSLAIVDTGRQACTR